MDLFNIVISPKALSQLDRYIDYITNTLMAPQAAMNLWLDAKETQKELSRSAGSLRYCEHPKLKALGYHPMLFLKHRYVMLYRIEGQIAYVDGIYHLLQDYENTFTRELK